jgi:hypothetical protein
MGEHSRRETILNLNQIVAYLLEAESLKKPRESSSSVDQTLAISGGGGIVENHGNKKKARMRADAHAIYVMRRIT